MPKPKITKTREQLQQELQQVLGGLLYLPNRDLIELAELGRICLGLPKDKTKQRDYEKNKSKSLNRIRG